LPYYICACGEPDLTLCSEANAFKQESAPDSMIISGRVLSPPGPIGLK
jgi:hypothetical protein